LKHVGDVPLIFVLIKIARAGGVIKDLLWQKKCTISANLKYIRAYVACNEDPIIINQKT